MPRDVATLRTMEHATQAYVLLIDGIPIGFTTDTSGALVGSGASSFVGRAEADLGETVGGRELREGLIVPATLEFGGDQDSLGLDRTTARFSVLLDSDTSDYFALSGEEPEEMLGRLRPQDDPAPPTVVGVTVRDRYIGLEYVGPSGERRMFPFLIGEALQGFDHHGDSDGGTVPASVSTRPLVHEGRLVALYRVFRDPSATFTTGSLAWPSLSNYQPFWVGKMRDAGTYSAGGRITIECTGVESLLERSMATVGGQEFAVTPEFTSSPGEDDQVSIYLAASEYITPGADFAGAKTTCQGRLWTTLSGDTRDEIQTALNTLLTQTAAGTGTDYETGNATFDATDGGQVGMSGNDLFVRREGHEAGDNYTYLVAIVAMHRRRWLALGFDPEQQDVASRLDMESQKDIRFTRLTAGGTYYPEAATASMGVVPGTGYYAAVLETIPIGDGSTPDYRWNWDNDGAPRLYSPLFEGIDLVRVIKPGGQQVVRLSEDPVLMDQTHVARSGSIDGTDCDAAGFFVFRGKIRKGEGSTDDASLVVDDEAEQVVVARCSWIVRDSYFADPGADAVPGLYIEQLYDPRTFGYAFKPLDRDWATLDLTGQQISAWASGSAAAPPEPAAQVLSAMLRSTGTSTGPNGAGVIQQGTNQGGAIGWFGDIYSHEMGLGIPDALTVPQSEITAIMAELPGGASGDLARCRPSWEESFPSFDALGAFLEPRGLRVGFDGGRFMLYRLADASPSEASVSITESDLYGPMGDPTGVWPQQRFRALAPADGWDFSYADKTHRVHARDPHAAMRRGDGTRPVNGRGLLAPELYGSDPQDLPVGGHWKNEARLLFGDQLARFLARRHGMVTLPVSRPKGQDLYPGALVLLSNPWVYGSDGTQGVSSVVGRVIRTVHHTDSGHCDADVLVFEGQWRSPPHYAPALRIWRVTSSTTLSIATQSNVPSSQNQKSGWERPDWATGGGGNARGALIRQLPDGTWAIVGTAEVDRISGNTVILATPLTGMPPDGARTMMLVPDVMASQPEWFQEVYSAVGIEGDNTRTRRFI